MKDEDSDSLGGLPMYVGNLVTLNVTGDLVSENGQTPKLPPLPEFLSDLRNVPDEDIAGRFAIEITPTNTINREAFKGPLYWRLTI